MPSGDVHDLTSTEANEGLANVIYEVLKRDGYFAPKLDEDDTEIVAAIWTVLDNAGGMP